MAKTHIHLITLTKSLVLYLLNRRCFLLLLSWPSTMLIAQATKIRSADVLAMPFGRTNQITYNLTSGTADVTYGRSPIITGAFAAARNGTFEVNSKVYTTRQARKITLRDALGTGTRYVITLTGKGLPAMQQVFDTYPDKSYFFTEISLRGQSISSNYLAPLVANQVNNGSTGDNRVLFVPFDNDTFIRYNAKSMSTSLTNTSSEVTAFYENTSRNGLVIGSVEHMVWKTGVKTTGIGQRLSELVVWSGYADSTITRDKKPHGTLSGNHVKSAKLFVGYFNDWRLGLEAYGKANRLAEPRYVFDWKKPTPVGWNSWGAIQTKLSLANAKSVVDFFANELKGFRNDSTAYIDLDSYWDNLSSGGLTGDFSQLKQFADYCKAQHLKPGIYWAPFVDWRKRDRTVEGSTYPYSEIWTKVNGKYHELDGARALDPTHPGTQQRLAYVINKFKDCGFEMIKIDFIGHAAIEADHFYDSTVTTGMQAFRKGMEFLNDQLADKMLIYVAISPSLATGRYAHMRRIACDAFHSMADTRYTLNSTNYGWWQTHLYDFIDADHTVFGTESEGVNRARLASALVTGTLITGDNYATSGQWLSRAQSLLQNPALLAIARAGIAFRPVEGNTGESATNLFVRETDRYVYLAVFNYEDNKTVSIDFSRIGLRAGRYVAKELYSNTTLAAQDSMKITFDEPDARIYQINKQSPERSEQKIR
ncbi:alpha-amylase family protein [Spirosoma validum]|uniref:Alpha-galactosidase n=1 Tax=Spirosoma validum TaxID=2771355 RepID=A0A927B9I7_9BACT|nr:alpha-galactosidase [Spirosoma validum]MBD2757667.1 alpha-galactosidase [Spirosoma validum]